LMNNRSCRRYRSRRLHDTRRSAGQRAASLRSPCRVPCHTEADGASLNAKRGGAIFRTITRNGIAAYDVSAVGEIAR
jgi:hypothetical protein